MSMVNLIRCFSQRFAFGLKASFLFILMMISLNGMAQTIDDPADGDGLVPIDGGVSMLLAAAAGLGAYRTARRQK